MGFKPKTVWFTATYLCSCATTDCDGIIRLIILSSILATSKSKFIIQVPVTDCLRWMQQLGHLVVQTWTKFQNDILCKLLKFQRPPCRRVANVLYNRVRKCEYCGLDSHSTTECRKCLNMERFVIKIPTVLRFPLPSLLCTRNSMNLKSSL